MKRTSRVQDQAILRLDGGKAFVTNADKGSKGSLTFEDAVAWSRNVVMSKVALKLGPTAQAAAEVLYDMWAKLGSAPRRAWTSPARCPGSCATRRGRPWRQIDVANGSFGQGVAVTLLQLATAFSAMVNGGILPTPHVVQRVGGGGGRGRRPRPGPHPGALGRAREDHAARPAGRALLPRPDPDPGLRRGRQDRHGPDLGRREEALEGQRLQLLVRRVRGAAEPRGRRRRPHRGGPADGPADRPDRDARRVVRALPARRDGCHGDPRPGARARRARRPRPAPRPRERGLCDTPGRDHRAGRAGRRRPVARRPPHRRGSRRGDGGHAAPPLRSPGPGRRGGLPPRDARLPLRRPARRADRRAPLPRRRRVRGRRGAARDAAPPTRPTWTRSAT